MSRREHCVQTNRIDPEPMVDEDLLQLRLRVLRIGISVPNAYAGQDPFAAVGRGLDQAGHHTQASGMDDGADGIAQDCQRLGDIVFDIRGAND